MNVQQEAVAVWLFLESRGEKPTRGLVGRFLRDRGLKFTDRALIGYLQPYARAAHEFRTDDARLPHGKTSTNARTPHDSRTDSARVPPVLRAHNKVSLVTNAPSELTVTSLPSAPTEQPARADLKRLRPAIAVVDFGVLESQVELVIANDAGPKTGTIAIGKVNRLRAALFASGLKYGQAALERGIEVAATKGVGMRYAIGVMRNFDPAEVAAIKRALPDECEPGFMWPDPYENGGKSFMPEIFANEPDAVATC